MRNEENAMTWLNQNWPYLLLLVGVVAFLSWRGGGGGFAGHHRSRGGEDAAPRSSADAGTGRPVSDGDAKEQEGTTHRHGGHGCC